MVFELLEVEVCFVADRHAISYHIRAFCGIVAGLDQVVRYIDGFVIAALDDFAVEGERWKRNFETDDVTFAEGGVGRHEVFGARHVDRLASDIAEAIAVGVEANGSVETSFAAGPAYTDMAAAVFLVAGDVVGGFDSAEDLAFPVPAPLAYANVCAGHAEAFFRSDTSAGKVEEDVWGGIFKIETGAEGFCF